MGIHHLLTGSYTHTNLFLLAFDTVAKTLTLNSTVPGFGLHQYVTSNAARDRVYATTMSEPPRIFSWSVSENFEFTHMDTVNISKSKFLPSKLPLSASWGLFSLLTIPWCKATSSCYFSDNGDYVFTAGGPGARINALTEDGGIGEEVHEMFYVPPEDIPDVDKTRSAVVSSSKF